MHILMTCMFEQIGILLGEIRYLLLLGLKGLSGGWVGKC